MIYKKYSSNWSSRFFQLHQVFVTVIFTQYFERAFFCFWLFFGSFAKRFFKNISKNRNDQFQFDRPPYSMLIFKSCYTVLHFSWVFCLKSSKFEFSFLILFYTLDQHSNYLPCFSKLMNSKMLKNKKICYQTQNNL